MGQISIPDDGADVPNRRPHSLENDESTDATANQIRREPDRFHTDINPIEPTTQNSLDFATSNAFEGAYGDATVESGHAYWPQNIWYPGQTSQLSQFDLHLWNL